MGINWEWGAEVRRKGDEGFNNAGILTFNSHAINSFVRELFQNSNDAKAKGAKKVKIKIEYTNIDRKEIPEFRKYIDILDAIKKSHSIHKKFFKKAYDIVTKIKIPFLVYSDYQTNGLSGDEGDNKSSFAACVLSEGVSAKETETAGGSYGIGKNAIYGISALRTVFYSSLNRSGDYIFQGVAKLASYKMDGLNHEGRIYLGEGEEMVSVRTIKNIPVSFQRKEAGLSQFVMGVELDSNWHEEFAKAILRNYWLLLMDDGLEVELLQEGKSILQIDSDNIGYLFAKFFKNDTEEYSLQPYGNPRLFYETLKDGNKVDLNISFLGKCSFYYKECDAAENNIAYLRNGMVIYSSIEKRLVGANVTGIFKCDTNSGNEILRRMEPPKHDGFEPEVLELNHDELSRKDGDKILREIKTKIREVIKELIGKYKEEIETPPFLTELFEDLQNAIINSSRGIRQNERSQPETIYRKAANEEIQISLDSESENSYISNLNGIITSSGAGLTNKNNAKEQKSNEGKKRGKKAGSSKKGMSHKYPIKSRIYFFTQKNGKNVYKVIVTSDTDLGRIEMSLYQYADSGTDIAFELNDVLDNFGKKINYSETKDIDGFVSEYKIYPDIKQGSNIFFLEISDSYKSAFVLNG